MDKEKKLEEIRRYIRKKAMEQSEPFTSEKYEKVKETLDKKDSKKEEFTFTVGEVNAYLG